MPDITSAITARKTDAEIVADLRAEQAEPNHPHAGCRASLRDAGDERDYVRAYRMIDGSFGK